MKTRNMTLFTAFAAAAAFASSAQASIVATGALNPVDTATWESGTVSQGSDIFIGNAANGTVTVNGGSTLNITHTGPSSNEITIGEKTAGNLGTLDIQAGGTVNVAFSATTAYFQIGGGASGSNGLLNVIGAGAALNVDGRHFQIGHNGDGVVVVDGGGVVNLTHSSAELEVGSWAGGEGLLTIQGSDGSNASTVQTQKLILGNFGNTGYVHMGVGGVLVVDGDKTGGTPTSATYFTAGNANSLFTLGGTGQIQYDNGGWTNMTGAAASLYTVEYHTSGEFSGSTVLTMVPEPSSMSLLAIGGLALLRRRRA